MDGDLWGAEGGSGKFTVATKLAVDAGAEIDGPPGPELTGWALAPTVMRRRAGDGGGGVFIDSLRGGNMGKRA